MHVIWKLGYMCKRTKSFMSMLGYLFVSLFIAIPGCAKNSFLAMYSKIILAW